MEILNTKKNTKFPNEFIEIINNIINKSPNLTQEKVPNIPKDLNTQKNIEKYILALISKIQTSKLEKDTKEDILEKTYKNLVKLRESNLPVFVDINIFVPEDMGKLDLYLEEKKKLENEVLFFGSKRKESFLTNCEEFNYKEKSPFFCSSKKISEYRTQLYIPKFNKLSGRENNFENKKKFLESGKILKYPSIFKSCSKNNEIFLSGPPSKNFEKGLKEKINKFKAFWKKKNETYPFAFMKKKIKKYGIDGIVYFEENYDIAKKEIPLKNDSE